MFVEAERLLSLRENGSLSVFIYDLCLLSYTFKLASEICMNENGDKRDMNIKPSQSKAVYAE